MSNTIPELAPRLVKPVTAAKYLAISERKLFSLTKAGTIPAVRLGRCVRYDVGDLDRFIANSKGAREQVK